MTARESILSYVYTLLAAVTGATAYRTREAPADRSEGVVILLKPEEEPIELRTANGSMVLRNLTIVITVISRGDVPDQLADPVIQAIHASIMLDRTLGGRCALLMEHSTKWDFEVADATAMTAELRYVARYQTKASDMSSDIIIPTVIADDSNTFQLTDDSGSNVLAGS
jgi:hypothetical protein